MLIVYSHWALVFAVCGPHQADWGLFESQLNRDTGTALIDDEVVGNVPDASRYAGAGEEGPQLVDVAQHLTAVTLIVALTALVVNDNYLAVGAADDAIGAQVLDAVLVP